MLEKQRIETGDNSTTVMAGRDVNHFNNGITYMEAKAICNDLFQLNLYKLKEAAETIATKRAEELINGFLQKLEERGLIKPEVFQDPDMQYTLVNAQIAYAKSGDKDVEDLLITLLIERVNQHEDDLSKIILNESLNVINLLTKEHLNILAAIFFMRYVKKHAVNRYEIIDYFNIVLGFIKKCTNTNTEIVFDHLAYSRCITPTNAFMHPAFATFEPYMEICFGVEISNDPNDMNKLLNTEPCFREIIKLWDNSYLSKAVLTSVGKAIAITYIRSQNILLPYETWLSCNSSNSESSID